MSFDVRPLISAFEDHRNPENARQMEQYLRNQFPFFGIKSPERQELVRTFINEYGLPNAEQLHDVVNVLWEQPQRECQAAALDVIGKAKRILNERHMPLFEWMIVTKSWWDTVDTIAPNSCGLLFKNTPHLIDSYADNWITNKNFWLRRAALLYQLKYKRATDEKRLFRYILLNTDSDQFFIQKAIGWVLREYSKTAPETVRQFIREHDFKRLSKREGLKWLNRHSTC